MPDVVIENAIRALKQRRDEIDAIIKSLERVAGRAARGVQPTRMEAKEEIAGLTLRRQSMSEIAIFQQLP